ncbi:MAG TPA: CarD family transcriptional regulator [Anaerolineaceae bacterium]|nr:CarD family transcriptional regulator [Anaerolineaceae bacterium]
MHYTIGDLVIHWMYGPGTVVAIDEKELSGVTQPYYVIEVNQFKLWVPANEEGEGSIRFPADSSEFEALFDILRSPGTELPDHQLQRKNELRARMQGRNLEGLCHVIRDLTDRGRHHSLNHNDSQTLTHAEDHLIDEWVLSLKVKPEIARRDLAALLEDPREETAAG